MSPSFVLSRRVAAIHISPGVVNRNTPPSSTTRSPSTLPHRAQELPEFVPMAAAVVVVSSSPCSGSGHLGFRPTSQLSSPPPSQANHRTKWTPKADGLGRHWQVASRRERQRSRSPRGPSPELKSHRPGSARAGPCSGAGAGRWAAAVLHVPARVRGRRHRRRAFSWKLLFHLLCR
jgi:hypothetical protein